MKYYIELGENKLFFLTTLNLFDVVPCIILLYSSKMKILKIVTVFFTDFMEYFWIAIKPDLFLS